MIKREWLIRRPAGSAVSHCGSAFALPFDGWIAAILRAGFNRGQLESIAAACVRRDDERCLWIFDTEMIAAIRKETRQ